ncbi:hypothetical protein Tco_1431795 [Tanacetum coccineum]
MHISRCKYDYECVMEVNRLETKVSNSDAEFVDVVVPEKKCIPSFMFLECHTVLPQIQDNSCSKELHIAPVVGDLMAINEHSDVKAEGVADNLMPDVVIKERFDDAEDYKVSFDLGGTFVTDADVEVPEALKLFLITFV